MALLASSTLNLTAWGLLRPYSTTVQQMQQELKQRKAPNQESPKAMARELLAIRPGWLCQDGEWVDPLTGNTIHPQEL